MTRLQEIMAQLNADLDALRYPYTDGKYRIVLPKGQLKVQGTEVYTPDGRRLPNIFGAEVTLKANDLIRATFEVQCVIEESKV